MDELIAAPGLVGPGAVRACALGRRLEAPTQPPTIRVETTAALRRLKEFWLFAESCLSAFCP